jgi:uncharacterized membrane protein YfcA
LAPVPSVNVHTLNERLKYGKRHLIFTLAGLAGTFVGAQLSKRLPAQKLKKAYAWFVIDLAIFLLADNLGSHQICGRG